jgi:hypothetical protein
MVPSAALLLLLASLGVTPVTGGVVPPPPVVAHATPGTPIADLLGGAKVPLAITLQEMGPDWRQFSLANGRALMATQSLLAAIPGGSGREHGPMLPSASMFFFTKGDVVVSAGQTYLVTYQGTIPAKEIAALIIEAEELVIDIPVPGKDTPLPLCLLNLAAVGNLHDVQPVDVPALIAEHSVVPSVLARARLKARQTQSMNNLKQLTLAVMLYAQDHEEDLPEAGVVWNVIKVDAGVLVQPGTGKQYVYNAWLSGKKLGEVGGDATRMVVSYEAEAWPDGKRCAAFLDGHVELMGEDQWTQAKTASHIP